MISRLNDILGKKWRQLSFLHVYHHTTIFLFYWLNVNVLYDGDIYLTIALNGFIHTVMYTYYFICMHTKDPKTGKSLPIWWKSSLTMLQLVQFVTMMSQGTYLLAGGCETCNKRVRCIFVIRCIRGRQRRPNSRDYEECLRKCMDLMHRRDMLR